MTIVSRVMRRLAVRTARGLVRRRGSIMALLVLVAGGIAITTLDLVQLPSTLTPPRAPRPPPATRAGRPGKPEATAQFIKANQVYDAGADVEHLQRPAQGLAAA